MHISVRTVIIVELPAIIAVTTIGGTRVYPDANLTIIKNTLTT